MITLKIGIKGATLGFFFVEIKTERDFFKEKLQNI